MVSILKESISTYLFKAERLITGRHAPFFSWEKEKGGCKNPESEADEPFLPPPFSEALEWLLEERDDPTENEWER